MIHRFIIMKSCQNIINNVKRLFLVDHTQQQRKNMIFWMLSGYVFFLSGSISKIQTKGFPFNDVLQYETHWDPDRVGENPISGVPKWCAIQRPEPKKRLLMEAVSFMEDECRTSAEKNPPDVCRRRDFCHHIIMLNTSNVIHGNFTLSLLVYYSCEATHRSHMRIFTWLNTSMDVRCLGRGGQEVKDTVTTWEGVQGQVISYAPKEPRGWVHFFLKVTVHNHCSFI